MKFRSFFLVLAVSVLVLLSVIQFVRLKGENGALQSHLAVSLENQSQREDEFVVSQRQNEDLWAQLEGLQGIGEVIEKPDRSLSAMDESQNEPLKQEAIPSAGPRQQTSQESEESRLAAEKAYQAFAQEWREGVERDRKEKRMQLMEGLQERKEFFAQIPLEGLAPEYRASQLQLLSELDRIQTLISDLDQAGMNSKEGNRLFKEAHAKIQVARQLMTDQREVLLYDFAQLNLGLNAEQTQSFLEYMDKTKQLTNMAAATTESLSEENRQFIQRLQSP